MDKAGWLTSNLIRQPPHCRTMTYHPPKLDAAGKDSLQALMHAAVEEKKTPAIFLGATDAAGSLFMDCAGDRVYGHPDLGKVDLNTTVQLFSATKIVTTAGHIVDQDSYLLANVAAVLDRSLAYNSWTRDWCHWMTHRFFSQHLPELANLQVLKGFADDGSEIIEAQDPKGLITLRMLLSHTSGLAYPWQEPVAKWMTSQPRDPLKFFRGDATIEDFIFPLVYQPGTDWNYSVGIDWAAFLLERITGESIANYYRKNIFEPCGMKSTTFYPTHEVKEHLMRLTHYDVDVKPVAYENSFKDGWLPREEDPDKVGPVLMGGAGLYTTAQDYLSFLRGVLASSTRLQTPATTTKPLLFNDSFKELFEDNLSPKGKKSLRDKMVIHTYHDPALLVDEAGSSIGHSVGLCLNFKDSKYGKKAGSGCWDGAAKTQYWLDPEIGIAGVCFTNLFSANPSPFMRFYNDYEAALYKALKVANQ